LAQYFYIEGYGCSLNISETEKISGYLKEKGFKKTISILRADFIILNTCSVKQVTEQRMLSRVDFFLEHKKPSAKIIATGCLSAAQPKSFLNISKNIIVLDTKLSSLCKVLGIEEKEFSPLINSVNSRECVSIIPISVGCLGACTYCSAHLARKDLHSYSVEEIKQSFKSAIDSGAKEIWLTSQDTGCYGFDIGSDLPSLLKELLKEKGDYRIRLGMMNPNHFIKIKKELIPLFEDARLYKFLHLPLQSGSDRVLEKMGRKYSVKEFFSCIDYAKKNIPFVSLATDIIVGFPGESEKDFGLSVNAVNKAGFDVVNISRFGKRKGTVAEKMPSQLGEEIKKERSRVLSVLCKTIFEKNNSSFVGKKVLCLVSEKTANGFNARTNEYRTVFIKGFDLVLGKFVKIKLVSVNGHYFKGVVV